MNSSKTAPQTIAESVRSSTGEVLGQYSAGGRVEANIYQLPHKGDRG